MWLLKVASRGNASKRTGLPGLRKSRGFATSLHVHPVPKPATENGTNTTWWERWCRETSICLGDVPGSGKILERSR